MNIAIAIESTSWINGDKMVLNGDVYTRSETRTMDGWQIFEGYGEVAAESVTLKGILGDNLVCTGLTLEQFDILVVTNTNLNALYKMANENGRFESGSTQVDFS